MSHGNEYCFIAHQCRILRIGLIVVLMLSLSFMEVQAESEDLGEMSRKLNNPLGNIWALQLELDWIVYDGDLTDSHRDGQSGFFQPILPIPLTDNFNILSRPLIPYVSRDIPKLDPVGLDFDWDRKSGLGDIELPLLLTSAKPEGRWQFGVGPTFSLPTATDDNLGSQRYGVGPAQVTVYKTKTVTAAYLAQYWFDSGGWGNESMSRGSLLYVFWYMLPGPGNWQIGTNPLIKYNYKADSGNKWNVPIGFTAGRMVKIGTLPIKFQAGVDYSVVHEDDFGSRWKFKFLITPVVKSLIQSPLFN